MPPVRLLSGPEGLPRHSFGSATFPFWEPRMASKGRGEEQRVGEEGQGMWVRRAAPRPPRPLPQGNRCSGWHGAGGRARSFSLVCRHYLFLKSVYNIYIYIYILSIYLYLYIYRVYVHVLHRPPAATSVPALSVIPVPPLVTV